MWERGILSDGGVNARKTSTLSGEPLIEGMLVGTDKDIMDTPQLHQVYPTNILPCHWRWLLTNRSSNSTKPSTSAST